MANGILVIDKPMDWTSSDVVCKLRHLLHEKRVGHGGTLDPMATGVLPIFIGRATRAVEFTEGERKEYLAGLKLGVETDTQDTTGTVLRTSPAAVDPAALEAVLPAFRGDIMQVPPMYSALKHNGQKLYDLARKGKTVDRPPRPVTIYALEVTGHPAPDEYTLRVECSKGTYIRTLCHDIGAALGCGGAMCALRRTWAAGFPIEKAIPLARAVELGEAGRLAEAILPVDAYFGAYPSAAATPRAETQIRNGAAYPDPGADGTYRVYSETGEFLMLGRRENGTMTTIKSFYQPV